MHIIPVKPQDCVSHHCDPAHHVTGPPHDLSNAGRGSVTFEEGDILAGIGKILGGPALEIGMLDGVSSRYICEGLENSESPKKDRWLLSIDPAPAWDPSAYKGGMIQLVKTYSHCFRPPKGIRWAFIDGDHRYDAVYQDAKLCWEAGIRCLVFHDTADWHDPKPTLSSSGSAARIAVPDFAKTICRAFAFGLVAVNSQCGLMILAGYRDLLEIVPGIRFPSSTNLGEQNALQSPAADQ